MSRKTPAVPSLSVLEAPVWPQGYSAWLPERISPIRRAGYTLVDLTRRGLIDTQAVINFRNETLLSDFAWRAVWADTDEQSDAESLATRLRNAAGIVVFIHGWAGSGDIWEDLPSLVVKANPDLVALVPDVNGFGGSPFSENVPPIDRCNPPANMRAIERWLNLLGLRPSENNGAVRPIIFVGHSMSGASLFFADRATWRKGELGRIALAPALLMNDRQRQLFYRTVGTGIRVSGWATGLDWLTERLIAPRFIERAAGAGSSLRVRAQHHRVFDVTPEGVIAQTFAAMGRLDATFDQKDWPHFIAYLANRDVLVGLRQTRELLERIHLKEDQIREVEGGHYFFSIGMIEAHSGNRQQVLKDILALHQLMHKALNKPASVRSKSKKTTTPRKKKRPA
jgi:pimeloyl-ACP methyl ester carboxylesterase